MVGESKRKAPAFEVIRMNINDFISTKSLEAAIANRRRPQMAATLAGLILDG